MCTWPLSAVPIWPKPGSCGAAGSTGWLILTCWNASTAASCLADLEKAHELAPHSLQFCYDLARMYRYQGRRRRAIAVLREAERLPTITSEDLVVSRLCRKMLPPLVRADARRQKRREREGKSAKPPIVAPNDSSKVRPDSLGRRQ
jgi:hypothetical protein